MTNSDLGVLVIGHGTRDPHGQAQMRSLACQTAGCLAPLPTDLGFLELAEPTIAQGIQRLHRLGIRRLVTVPVLLFRSGHAGRVIPVALRQAAEPLGMEIVCQTDPLEHQEMVVELSAERFRQAISEARAEEISPSDIALGLIARGSSSQTAASAMEKFAELRCAKTAVAQCRVGYVAVRHPNVQETLDWLESTDAQLLVVQPHLFFEGEVYHSLQAATAARRKDDGRQWLVTQTLGAPPEDFGDERLARVLAGLVEQAVGGTRR